MNKLSLIFKLSASVFLALLFFSSPGLISAAEQQADFFVDSQFDLQNRAQLTATLIKTGFDLYYYADQQWWNGLSQLERGQIYAKLDTIDNEFSQNAYPKLTAAFGAEWRPGLDNDNRTVVLLQPMQANAGGYFRSADEYLKIQHNQSNQREMIYLNVTVLTKPNPSV